MLARKIMSAAAAAAGATAAVLVAALCPPGATAEEPVPSASPTPVRVGTPADTPDPATTPPPAATDPGAAPSVAAGVRVLSLGRSAGKRITVVTANVEEYLNVHDNRDGRDMRNFATRLKSVLLAERNRGTAAYTPDLILLQEVNRTTVHRVRMLVSRSLGVRYAVAGGARSQPARGRGAIVRHRGRGHALLTRSTAVLYNTATMRKPSAARMITFGYPKAQVYRWRQCPYTTSDCQANMWESRQSAVFRIVAKHTGRAYAVASIHFVPYRFLRPRLHPGQAAGFRQAIWLAQVRQTMNRHFRHARQIIGGDFNERLCADGISHLGQSTCSTRSRYTPMYREALRHRNLHPAVGYGIDNIFTLRPIVASGKDATYKLAARSTTAGGLRVTARTRYLTVRDFDRRFSSAGAFDRCNAAFNAGAGGSFTARRIAGCTDRFYSDHPFDWAVVV